jgi:predicted nucleic acid-binding protein
VIVYVETNFVLEQAFLQEENGSCTRLLEAAEAKDIELVLPAYSIGEPYEKLIRRRRERRQLSDRLRQELHELRRSAPYANEAEQYSDLARLLIDSNEQENQRLNEILFPILEIATIIPTDADVLKNALIAQRDLGPRPHLRHLWGTQDEAAGADRLHAAVAVATPPPR